MNDEILRAEHITKCYEAEPVVRDVSLTLCHGELVCLLGVSGSGKTTLFHVLSGLSAPEEGRVFLRGEDITSVPGSISYMLQKDMLLSHKRIVDNVSLPLIIRGTPKKQAREKASKYFEQFGLGGTEMKYPSQLSGGMRQRAALLRTYLGSQGVALLDEPFSSLDAFTKSEMHSWYLRVMGEIELATLFITHDIDEAVRLSDRIYILGDKPGRILAELAIKQKRPREADFSLTDEFLNYKREILTYLNK